MPENIHQGYWAVVPAPILNDETLPTQAKLLYPVIASLTGKTGYCWASNEYLAKWFAVSERTVSRWVRALEQGGYIRCEMLPTDEGRQRRIYAGIVCDRGVDKNVQTPGGVDKNVQGGADKNVQAYIEDDKKSSDNIPPKSPKHKPEWFSGFWDFYPHERRGSLQRAIKAWDKLKPDEATKRKIALALKRFKACDVWTRGVGIPLASTFLNPDNEYWLHPENFLGNERMRIDPDKPRQTVVESRYEKL